MITYADHIQSRSSHLLKRCLQPSLASRTTPRFLSTRVPLDSLRPVVRDFVDEYVRLCQPDKVHVCDGSVEENDELLKELRDKGRLVKLNYDNWWVIMYTARWLWTRFICVCNSCGETSNVNLSSYLAQTSPADVARVEKQTYICSDRREDTIPTPMDGVKSSLGNWMSPADMDIDLDAKFTGCMKGLNTRKHSLLGVDLFCFPNDWRNFLCTWHS